MIYNVRILCGEGVGEGVLGRFGGYFASRELNNIVGMTAM